MCSKIPTKKDAVAAENLFTLDCPVCAARYTTITLVCAQCQTMLRGLLDLNPFDLFGVLPATALDDAVVKSAYISAQKALHPDQFILKPDVFSFATQVSSRVNEALATLQCPFRRAQAFLDAHSIEPLLDKVAVDEDVLQDLLVLREQACSDDVSERRETLPLVSQRIKKSLQDVARCVDAHKHDDARQAVATLSYLLRIKKDAKKTSFKSH